MNNPEIAKYLDNLLVTKIDTPKTDSRIVHRDRLLHTLDENISHSMTQLVAPTGYGKTTLLLDWLSSENIASWQIAWVTLDEYNNVPIRFWGYIITSLKKAYPQIRFSPHDLLHQEIDSISPEALNPLINELASLPEKIILVLDDYHTITNENIHKVLTYFIENKSDNLHLIISSRTTPPISVSRLYAQGQVLKITEQELTFTISEAKIFLLDVMHLDLPLETFNHLMEITEGWIAGLQIGALSYHNQINLLSQFSQPQSNNRLVYDYLIEETLNHQNPEIKEFLLKTSILNELCAPLCDYVLEINNSQEIFAAIENANLFLISLDNNLFWFRYHSLFAESLSFQLKRLYPNEIAALHRRAYQWLLENGFPEKAITHALAAEDYEKAADIVDQCALNAINAFDIVSLTQWISHFSNDLFIKRPRLGIYNALANFLLNHVDQAEHNLNVIEEILESNPELFSNEKIQTLNWEISVLKAAITYNFHNQADGLLQLEERLNTDSIENSYFYGFGNHTLASAYLMRGKLDLAYKTFEKGLTVSLKQNYPISQMLCFCDMAKINKDQGLLLNAKQNYKRALTLAEKTNLDIDVTSLAISGILEIQIEQNEIEQITHPLTTLIENSQKIIEGPHIKLYKNFILLRMVKCCFGINDLENAKNLLNYILDFSTPETSKHRYSSMVSAESFILSKYIEENEELAKAKLQEVENLLSHKEILTSKEQFALARINIISNHLEAAQKNLETLLNDLKGTEMQEMVLKTLILLALTYHLQENSQLAISSIEEALSFAENAGYFRIFLDEGPVMKTLLEIVLQKENDTKQNTYLEKLLTEFEVVESTQKTPPSANGSTSPMELLSERETEIFTSLIAGKTYKEIASQLVISLNTVKVHIRHIYKKLNVNSRKELRQYIE